MLPHAIPFDEANVATDQPWLTPVELEFSEQAEENMAERMAELMEGVLPEMRSLLPGHHFILTTDYRIVEEPNFFRFGMFLDRANHRYIDKTQISTGREDRGNGKSPRRGDVYVSTVFVGGSERELFETMIFGGLFNLVKWRSNTLVDAKKCHWEVVTIARELDAHLRRHGKTFRKDWVRMAKFWQLTHKRGPRWAYKHSRSMLVVFRRLTSLPGNPQIPMGNELFEFIEGFIPRRTLAKNPLL